MNRNEAFRKRNPETARPHENLKESIYTLLRSRAINPDKLLKKEPKVKVTLQFDSQTKGRIPTEVITFVNEQAPGRNIEIDTIETNFKRFLDPYSRTYKESSSIVITNINPEKREEIANRIVIDITPGMISYDVISQSEGEEVKGKAIDPQVVSAITSMIPDLPKGKS